MELTIYLSGYVNHMLDLSMYLFLLISQMYTLNSPETKRCRSHGEDFERQQRKKLKQESRRASKPRGVFLFTCLFIFFVRKKTMDNLYVLQRKS